MNKAKIILSVIAAGVALVLAAIEYFGSKDDKTQPATFTTDWGARCPYPKGSAEAANWIKINRPKPETKSTEDNEK